MSGGRAAPVAAQTSLDIGGIALASHGSRLYAGAEIAPLIRGRWGHAYLEGSGSAASFENGTWTADADGLFAWRPSITAIPGAELVAGLGGARASGGDLTDQLWGRVRYHIPVNSLDLWIGGGGGQVDGLLGERRVTVGEAGVVWSDTRWSASALATPTWVDADTRYADLVGSVRFEGKLRMTGIIGFRQQWAPRVVDRGWIAWSAERPLSRVTTLVVSAGSFPEAPAPGFLDGRYLTLGVRVGRAERVPFGPPRSSRAPTTTPGWERARLTVRTLGEDRYEVTASIPSAGSVEIAGDFTDWRPLPLLPSGERWVAQLTLAPGVHRLNLRINGGAWRAPPSLPTTTDEFGGEVGVLVVP